MPSYIDENLPSYYADAFPANVTQWKIIRETSRIFSGQRTVNKMRVMEWAVRALFNLDDNAALIRAAEIAENERYLPQAQQNVGNLLAVLTSKFSTDIHNHEQIEEMFKFVFGKLEPKNTVVFNTLLNIIADYARAYSVVLPQAVIAYDDQHREFSATYLLRLKLPPVVATPAPRFTPLADQQNQLTATAKEKDPSFEDELQAALALSLQEDPEKDKSATIVRMKNSQP